MDAVTRCDKDSAYPSGATDDPWLILERTGEYYAYAGILTEMWRGAREGGGDVVALVAAVTMPGHLIGVTPVPPPMSDLPPTRQYGMTRLWQLGTRLTDAEIDALVDLAQQWHRGRISATVDAPCGTL
jgi:hypothetical protein